jgi:hypothetical protein
MAFIVAGGALLLALLVGIIFDGVGESPLSKCRLSHPRDLLPDEVEKEDAPPDYEDYRA